MGSVSPVGDGQTDTRPGITSPSTPTPVAPTPGQTLPPAWLLFQQYIQSELTGAGESAPAVWQLIQNSPQFQEVVNIVTSAQVLVGEYVERAKVDPNTAMTWKRGLPAQQQYALDWMMAVNNKKRQRAQTALSQSHAQAPAALGSRAASSEGGVLPASAQAQGTKGTQGTPGTPGIPGTPSRVSSEEDAAGSQSSGEKRLRARTPEGESDDDDDGKPMSPKKKASVPNAGQTKEMVNVLIFQCGLKVQSLKREHMHEVHQRMEENIDGMCELLVQKNVILRHCVDHVKKSLPEGQKTNKGDMKSRGQSMWDKFAELKRIALTTWTPVLGKHMNLSTFKPIDSGDETVDVEKKFLDTMWDDNCRRLAIAKLESGAKLANSWKPDKTRPHNWLPNGSCMLLFRTYGHLAGEENMHEWFNVPLDNRGSGNTGAEEAKIKGKEKGRAEQRRDTKKAMVDLQVQRSAGTGSQMLRESQIATYVKEEQTNVIAQTAHAQMVALEKRAMMQEYDQKKNAAEAKVSLLQKRFDRMSDGPAKDALEAKLESAEADYEALLDKGATGVLLNYVAPVVPSVSAMRENAQKAVAKRENTDGEGPASAQEADTAVHGVDGEDM